MLLPGISLGLLYTIALIAALLAAGSRWRRGMAVLVSGTGLSLAFFVPAEYPTFRAFLGLGSLLFLGRIVELVRVRRSPTVPQRLWHAVGLVDTLRVRRIEPRVDRSALIRLLVGAPIVVIAWAAVDLGSEHLSGGLRLAVRWSAGAVFLYTGVELGAALIILFYGLLGIDPRPLHDDPILSRSISEFWTRRWNQVVHRFLKMNAFAPMARRGYPEWGLVLAFLLSAAFHFLFMLPPVGPFWAGMMGAFFLLQMPFLWLERALGVVRWPTLLGRAWTLTLLLGSSPLFVEPVLRIVDTWG